MVNCTRSSLRGLDSLAGGRCFRYDTTQLLEGVVVDVERIVIGGEVYTANGTLYSRTACWVPIQHPPEVPSKGFANGRLAYTWRTSEANDLSFYTPAQLAHSQTLQNAILAIFQSVMVLA